MVKGIAMLSWHSLFSFAYTGFYAALDVTEKRVSYCVIVFGFIESKLFHLLFCTKSTRNSLFMLSSIKFLVLLTSSSISMKCFLPLLWSTVSESNSFSTLRNLECHQSSFVESIFLQILSGLKARIDAYASSVEGFDVLLERGIKFLKLRADRYEKVHFHRFYLHRLVSSSKFHFQKFDIF